MQGYIKFLLTPWQGVFQYDASLFSKVEPAADVNELFYLKSRSELSHFISNASSRTDFFFYSLSMNFAFN